MILLPPPPFLPQEPPPPPSKLNSLYTLEPIVNSRANLKLFVLSKSILNTGFNRRISYFPEIEWDVDNTPTYKYLF